MDKITWLTTVDSGTEVKILVGFETGEIRTFDEKGDLVAVDRLDGEVTHLRAAGDTVVCATSAGTVTAFRPVS